MTVHHTHLASLVCSVHRYFCSRNPCLHDFPIDFELAEQLSVQLKLLTLGLQRMSMNNQLALLWHHHQACCRMALTNRFV